MKKILTLIVMAVAFAMPSQAQFSFGVQAGLNLTNISDFSLNAAGRTCDCSRSKFPDKRREHGVHNVADSGPAAVHRRTCSGVSLGPLPKLRKTPFYQLLSALPLPSLRQTN